MADDLNNYERLKRGLTMVFDPPVHSDGDLERKNDVENDYFNSLIDEVKSGVFNVRYTPWKCHLFVRRNELEEEFDAVTYFVRQNDPARALSLAALLWSRWEKEAKGLGQRRYPRVVNKGTAICIDDGDWKEYLKFGHRRARAMKKNPDQWNKLGEFCYAGDNPHFPLSWTMTGQNFDPPSNYDLDFDFPWQ